MSNPALTLNNSKLSPDTLQLTLLLLDSGYSASKISQTLRISRDSVIVARKKLLAGEYQLDEEVMLANDKRLKRLETTLKAKAYRGVDKMLDAVNDKDVGSESVSILAKTASLLTSTINNLQTEHETNDATKTLFQQLNIHVSTGHTIKPVVVDIEHQTVDKE